jgi:MFS family permease
VGGGLVGLVTAPIAVAADAASYAASVLSLLLIRVREVVEPRVQGSRLRSELAEGVQYVLRHPLLRPIAMCTGTVNFFTHMGNTVLILYAVRELGLGAGIIGLWYSLGSLGAPVGAASSQRLAARFGAGRSIALMTILWPISWVLMPAAPRSFPLPMLIASGLIGSFSGVAYNVTQVSLRQGITPQRLQGRMNATMRFLVWGTIPLGTFVGGVLGSTVGLHATLWIATAGNTLPMLPILLSSVPRVRSLAELQAAV